MKVLSVIEKSYTKDGQTKPLWECALQKADGTTIGATAYEPIKTGEEVADDRVHPGKKEGTWVIYSDKKSKGTYQKRDEELAVAQCIFKGMIDLQISGHLQMFDSECKEYYQASLTNLGAQMGQTILNIANSLRNRSATVQTAHAATPAAPAAPAAPDEFDKEFPKRPHLNSKQLFTKIKEAQVTIKECQQIPGFEEAVNANDYDKAWTLVSSKIK